MMAAGTGENTRLCFVFKYIHTQYWMSTYKCVYNGLRKIETETGRLFGIVRPSTAVHICSYIDGTISAARNGSWAGN